MDNYFDLHTVFNLQLLRRLVCFLFLLFSLNIVFSQNYAEKKYYLVDSLVWSEVSEDDKHIIDSCMIVFHKVKNDTLKMLAVIRIIDKSWDEKVWHRYNEWMYVYAKKCLAKSGNSKKTKKRIKIFLSSALNNKGVIALNKGEVEMALKYLHESLELEKQTTGDENIATSLSNIAFVYSNQGDIPKALDYYHQALSFQETNHDSIGISRSYNNIGFIYQNIGDNKKALEYYNKSLTIRLKTNDKMGIAVSYSNLAEIYGDQKDYLKAIEFYEKGNVIYKSIGNMQGFAGGLNNIGYIYLMNGDLYCKEENRKCLKQGRKIALEFFEEGFKIQKEMDDKAGMTSTLYNMAKLFWMEGNISESDKLAQQAYTLSKELGYPENIRRTSSLLKELNFNKGNYKEAFLFFKEEIKMRDSLEKKDNYKLAQQKQAKYFYSKMRESDSIAFAEQKRVMTEKQKMKDDKQRAELKLKETQQWFLFSGLAILILFLIFLFNRFKLIRGQKKIIESQNLILEEKSREILDSINYAKGIQEAILPSHDALNLHLKKGFVLYKPKDIVAGDFYWLEHYEDKLYVAVADCTGHGVPGAMMSVVCSGALNRAIKEFNLSDPGKILDKAREIVIETLSRNESKVNDGMDISLCCFNHTSGGNFTSVLWAGANNPLWISRNEEMLVVNADKQPVGRYYQYLPFTTHSIELKKDDMIYLFSDGYADQFGGDAEKKSKGKKFKYSSLKKLLLSVRKEDPNDQCNVLEKEFNDWKGDFEQIDDVCIIGVRV
jgi:serine phosphatase RsbU (regulator of sigma subunit)/tetratricopeptide (TPR) repeat protein